MIYVKLIGHNYQYEIYELLRLFYSDNDICFDLDEKALNFDQSLFIESILEETNGLYRVITNILKNSEIISKYEIEDVNKIDIKENDINKKIKYGIKQSAFEAIKPLTNTRAPWGILTGIRPTKIVHKLLDKGYNDKDIISVFRNVYKVDLKNSMLVLDIAKRERKKIYPLDSKKFSLYISIPFCPTRCIYCSFPSNSLMKYNHLVDEYTDKLLFELEEVVKLTSNMKIDTVYIGGGTPTSIPIDNLHKIISKINEFFPRKEVREFTVEAGRPDTIKEDMLNMLKSNKVDRISINPQTMNQKTLDLIGRSHSPQDIIDSYYLARKIGFPVINMDIIAGLPQETVTEFKNTLDQIKKLDPDNLTVHTMTIKKASKLKENINKFKLSSQETVSKMLSLAEKYTREMNLNPYYLYRQKHILGNFENIGYSKEGKESIYNMEIMEEKETIIALGAGAISKIFYPDEDRIERVPNVKSLTEYIKRVTEMVNRKKKHLTSIDRY